MRVLVIGSTSIVGLALKSQLTARGHQVELAGRRNADVRLDVSSPLSDYVGAISYDAIVNAAAEFNDSDFVHKHSAALVNSLGPIAVAKLAVQAGAKHVVHLSSVSISEPFGNRYFTWYSLSKRHGEEVMEFVCAENKLALTVVRPSQIYEDSGASKKHQPLFFSLVEAVQGGRKIFLNGSNDAVRNYIHVEDVCNAIVHILEEKIQGTYQLAHPESHRLTEVIRLASAAFGKEADYKFSPELADIEDYRLVPDNSLYEDWGCWPSISLSEGLHRIRTWGEDQR